MLPLKWQGRNCIFTIFRNTTLVRSILRNFPGTVRNRIQNNLKGRAHSRIPKIRSREFWWLCGPLTSRILGAIQKIGYLAASTHRDLSIEHIFLWKTLRFRDLNMVFSPNLTQNPKVSDFMPMVGVWKNRISQKDLVFEQISTRPFLQNKN